MSLREKIPFEKRSEEAYQIRAKYPNRIPVICERAPRSDLPQIEKKKFLVPVNMLVGEFKYIIHKHIMNSTGNPYGGGGGGAGGGGNFAAEKTIYLFVNNVSPKTGSLISEIYEQHKDEDGFLYMEYSAENTLGGKQHQGDSSRKGPVEGGIAAISGRGRRRALSGRESSADGSILKGQAA